MHSPLRIPGHPRPMQPQDYAAVYALWSNTEGMDLGEDDTEAAVNQYLRRNPQTCLVLEAEGQIVATLMCGHDGRRALLRHLAVHPGYRGQGLARALLDTCLAKLKEDGIRRCNLFVLDSNPDGQRFWEKHGWQTLTPFWSMMQRVI